jgi:hypothetical protein
MSVTSGRNAGSQTGTQVTERAEESAEAEPALDPGSAARELAAARAGRLAALCRELEGHGLRHRLLGLDGSLVRAVHPGTGRTVIVLATPASPTGQEGWSYLWSGGGVADADEPAQAAEEIARALG